MLRQAKMLKQQRQWLQQQQNFTPVRDAEFGRTAFGTAFGTTPLAHFLKLL